MFRSKVGWWCALLALAVQLVLPFGHIHWNGSASAPLQLLTANSSALSDIPVAPASPAGLAVDACAVCALAGLAGPPAAPPTLSLPTPRVAPLHVSIALPPAAKPHRLFQSRAPPRA